MSTAYSSPEQETCGVVLIHPATDVVLVEHPDGVTKLPALSIPRHTRPAEQLTSAIQDRWSLHTVVLDWLQGYGQRSYAVLELLDAVPVPAGDVLISLPVSQLSCDLLPQEALDTIRRILKGEPGTAGPFSRVGWVEDTKHWIRQVVRNEALEFQGAQQLNAGGFFALTRFDAGPDCPAYWLKAVGKPNEQEFHTTSYLVEHCPEFLPQVIGMRPEWNAWIMEEFGRSLHYSDSIEDFENAAVRLAELQKNLIGREQELIAAGFADQRMPTLKAHLDAIIAYLEEAMARQTSTKAAPLSREHLRGIRFALGAACDTMNHLHIPDTVMHGDFSPGSILGDRSRCVFTDWCEAYVGNPFLTLEQLCVHIARKTDQPDLWRARLTQAYVTRWQDQLNQEQIQGALRLAPLLGVLSYLYGRGEWLHSEIRNEPSFQAYSRGLARHIARILKDSPAAEALCPQA